MAIPFKLLFPVSTLVAFVGVLLAYLAVPNEQSFPMNYPNVMFVSHRDLTEKGSAVTDVVPVRYDNVTLGSETLEHLSGLYQFEFFFYHDRFAAFEKYTKGGPMRIWECAMFCKPKRGPNSRLFLVHRAPPGHVSGWRAGDMHREPSDYEDDVDEDGKRKPGHHIWYLVEMNERDTDTPIIYARTKMRKKLEISGVPWVEPDSSRSKPVELPIQLYSIWDILRPDNPPVITGWVITLIGLGVFMYFACKSDDEDY